METNEDLVNEYLRNGNIKKITDPKLLEEIIAARFDPNGELIGSSVGLRFKVFSRQIVKFHTSKFSAQAGQLEEYKSLRQKENHFEQNQIDTEEEFDAFYNHERLQSSRLYRGQSEAAWRLYNRLQRQYVNDEIQEEISYLDLIKALTIGGVNHYTEKYTTDIGEDQSNSVSNLNNISTLGYLQHFGCPTPLLDWTSNLDIGLFFCFDGQQPNNQKYNHIGDYCSLYMLNESDIDEVSLSDLMSTSLLETEQTLTAAQKEYLLQNGMPSEHIESIFSRHTLFDRESIKSSDFVEFSGSFDVLRGLDIAYIKDPFKGLDLTFNLRNNRHIINQDGTFIFSNSAYEPLEVFAESTHLEQNKESDGSEYRFCQCVNISKHLREYIQNIIGAQGINKNKVYPEFHHSTYEVYSKIVGKIA